MPQHDTNQSSRPLPLTEARGPDPTPPRTTPPTDAEIRLLVDTFYTSIQTDALLGPIFARHVKDWSIHLPKMYDFWSTVMLRTGRYAGRPIEVHERIPELTSAHFDRWLSLWTQAVNRVIPHAARAGFIVAAERMALSMSARLASA